MNPGPVGLQLEPVNEEPVYGCRVVRFVDGGPNDPGQARKSGKVQPGDLVLKVEAEGSVMSATTYEEIIGLLKHTHVKRILTVRSVWEETTSTVVEEERPKNRGFIPTRKPTTTQQQVIKSNNNPSRFSGTTTSKMMTPLPSVAESQQNVKPFEPSTPPLRSTPVPPESIRTPSDMVLLSNSLEDGSRTSTAKSTTDGPIIVPLNDLFEKHVHENDDEDEINFEDSPDGDVVSRSRSSSFHSQQTTKSSNKSANEYDMAPQALADQFLLIDGYAGFLVPESSYISYSQSMSTTTSSDTANNSNTESIMSPATPNQDFVSSKDNSLGCDSVKSQLKYQHDLLDQTLIRADYEQRLQEARMEHSKNERELKDLYVQSCQRNESKIRELQIEKDKMEKRISDLESTNYELHEESTTRTMELDMSRTMMKEMEDRVRSVETEKNDLALRLQEAFDYIEKVEDALQQKDQEIEANNSQLFADNEKINTLSVQLTNESNARKAATERVTLLSNTVQELKTKNASDHQQYNERIRGLEETVKQSHERLQLSEKENHELETKLQNYITAKEESEALSQTLSKSMQEKQKELLQGQSEASKLEKENEILAKQIADTNSDVELLLQEKLEMEKKFADTWKDYEQAKKDASTIHETLMEKLENGEFFTSADIQEKEAIIEQLENELHDLKESHESEKLRETKRSLNLQIQSRGVERNLRH